MQTALQTQPRRHPAGSSCSSRGSSAPRHPSCPTRAPHTRGTAHSPLWAAKSAARALPSVVWGGHAGARASGWPCSGPWPLPHLQLHSQCCRASARAGLGRAGTIGSLWGHRSRRAAQEEARTRCCLFSIINLFTLLCSVPVTVPHRAGGSSGTLKVWLQPLMAKGSGPGSAFGKTQPGVTQGTSRSCCST